MLYHLELYYDLDILESLVFGKLNPSSSSGASKVKLEEWKSIALSEKARLKKHFIKIIFEYQNDSLVQFYFRNHQNRLTLLADTLYNYLSKEDPLLNLSHKKHSLKNVQKLTYTSVLDLLSFIETRFSNYINPDEKVPEGIKYISITTLKTKLEDLITQDNLQRKELLAIITTPLKEFIENPGNVTASRLMYIQELVDVCQESFEHKQENDFVIYLTKRLIYINYNTIPFFNFITDLVRTSINSIESLPEKIDKLSWYLKEINQTQVNPQLCYNKDIKSLKELFALWIIEELSYYEKSLEMGPPDSGTPKFKVPTDLSVSQLAFLLRVLIDTGVIKSNNDRELLKNIASIVKSKRTETISPESLRTKYYNFDESTKKEIISLILELLNYAQQM